MQTAIRYTRQDGTDDGNDCLAAANPCATIQHAVDLAAPGDEIWVAAGIYTGVQARDVLTQHLYISQSVTIRGGYTAVFDDPPDPENNLTILDAQLAGRVVYISEGASVTLAGLQLTNGQAGTQNGGGLYARQANVSLADITFSDNRAEFGGGLYVVQGRLTVQHSRFSRNVARLGGGGARLYGSTAVLSHNTFSDNATGFHGGALYITAGQTTLRGTQIENNTVTDALQGWGGGLHLNGGRAILAGNDFSGNQAHTGGGLRLFQSQAVLEANLLRGNQAILGGGMSLETNSAVTLTNNTVVDNTTALYVLNAVASLRHTTIARNAEGLVVDSGQVELANSIIADQAAGILNTGGVVTMTATLWDGVGQPVVGVVNESGAITGTAAFAADGYRLTAVSDAIDNGLDVGVASDGDGLPRPIGGGFDLGAYEWRDLTAIKTVQPAIAAPGMVVTYTIVLTAPATPTMTAVLTDMLPAEVTFVGPLTFTSGSGGYNSGVITWTGQIFTETAVSIQWPVQLNVDLPPGSAVANTAVIQSAAGVAPSTTAVVTVPAKIYLPIIMRP